MEQCRRVNIADYVRMALRTTSTRATLQGAAKRFAELGYDTVLISQYGGCSETCEPYQGKVYIDDVFTIWNGERSGDFGKSNYCDKWFMLLSVAIRGGLFHPNCRHTMGQYIEGLTKIPQPIPAEKIREQRELEEKQRAMERKIRALKRKVEGTQDEKKVKEYKRKLREEQGKLREFIKEHDDVLSRDYSREKIYTSKISQISGSSNITFPRVDNSAKIDKSFADELKVEYDKFTTTFGELPNLKDVNISPYYGYGVYGSFNPNSGEITLMGIGGKKGKSFITQVASAEHKSGQWSTASPYHSFRHELGHALQERMKQDKSWEEKVSKIEKIIEEMKKELTDLDDSDIISYKKKKLSLYGFTNTDEFISECIAEYVNSPVKSRKTAKAVAEILLQKE